MKQKITVDQYNELSDIGKERLTKWLEEKGYGTEVDGEFVTVPQLDIGQMIEFLINEDNFNLDYSGLDNTWGVMIGEKEIGGKEFCDALWVVVKELLEQRD